MMTHFETQKHFPPSQPGWHRSPDALTPVFTQSCPPRWPWVALSTLWDKQNTHSSRSALVSQPTLQGGRSHFKPTWGFCQYFICVTHISSEDGQTKPQCFIRSCNSLHLSYRPRLLNPTRALGICVEDKKTLLVASGLITLTALEGLGRLSFPPWYFSWYAFTISKRPGFVTWLNCL